MHGAQQHVPIARIEVPLPPAWYFDGIRKPAHAEDALEGEAIVNGH